jgi:hypothetical protein
MNYTKHFKGQSYNFKDMKTRAQTLFSDFSIPQHHRTAGPPLRGKVEQAL